VAPDPLPPIGEEDIHLVGWIVLEVANDGEDAAAEMDGHLGTVRA